MDVQPTPKQESRDYMVSPPIEVHHVEQQAQAPQKDEVPEVEVVVDDVEDIPSPEQVDVDAPSEEQVISVSDETNAEEAPKKSYASIVSLFLFMSLQI